MIYFFSRPPIRSGRGQRIADRPRVTNANRREYGKGMVGRWLNRTIKRKRLTSTVKKQMESLSDHRLVNNNTVIIVQRQALTGILFALLEIVSMKII